MNRTPPQAVKIQAQIKALKLEYRALGEMARRSRGRQILGQIRYLETQLNTLAQNLRRQ